MKENIGINELNIEYDIKFSKRQTVGIKIIPPGLVLVTAPIRMSVSDVKRAVESKANWLYKKLKEVQNAEKIKEKNTASLSEKEKLNMKKQLSGELKIRIEDRIKYYKMVLNKYDILPAAIRVKSLRASWGSCSSSRNISFNWKLALAPPEVLDYVIVHEICHLVHMNHSPQFWDLVEKVKPDAKVCKQWLKKNGVLLDL